MIAAASCWTTTPGWSSTSSGTAPRPSNAKVPLQLIMAKARHKNLRIAMRYVKPGGEAVAGITGILGPSRRRR